MVYGGYHKNIFHFFIKEDYMNEIETLNKQIYEIVQVKSWFTPEKHEKHFPIGRLIADYPRPPKQKENEDKETFIARFEKWEKVCHSLTSSGLLIPHSIVLDTLPFPDKATGDAWLTVKSSNFNYYDAILGEKTHG
jgi:hypothetical protein